MEKICSVCGSTDVIPKGKYCLGIDESFSAESSILELPLVCCKNCGFVYVSPLPCDDNIDRYYTTAAFWQQKMSTSVNYKFSNWREVFKSNSSLDERLQRAERQFAYIRKYAKNFGKDASVLDVGAGFSPFLYVCQKNKLKNLYAIEPLQEICDFLKKQGVTITTHMVEEWFVNSPDRKYDLIVVSHVLEHLKNPEYFLSRIGKFLKLNGILCIEVPNRDDRQQFHCGLHFLFFDVNTLKLILEKHSFKVINAGNVKYNLSGLVIHKILLFYYALFSSKRNFSIHSSFFTHMYYKVWLPIKKIFRIKLYIYISSNDVASLSCLNDDKA